MLIELSPELMSGPDPRGEPTLSDAVSNLCGAHRSGQHLLYLDRQVAGWLLDGVELREQDRGLLRLLRGKATAQAATLDWAPERVQVVSRSAAGARWEGKVCRVPWTWFTPHARAAPASLIGEDLGNDVAIYSCMATALLRELGYHCALDCQSGGGDRTGLTLANRAGKPGLAIGIVDSDRPTPTSKLGETAWKAAKAVEDLNARVDGAEAHRRPLREGARRDAIAHLVVLNARALENLIPVELWRAALLDPQDPGRIDRLERLGFLEGAGNAWMDLKDGLWCRRCHGADAEAVYARSVLSAFPPGELAVPDCTAQGCADGHKLGECCRRLVEGLGPGALKRVAAFLASSTPHSSPLRRFDLDTHEELRRVIHLIAAWGIAPAPTAT